MRRLIGAMRTSTSWWSCLATLTDEVIDTMVAAYRQNYARLREVKKEYHPASVLCLNQNIQLG